MKRWLIFPPTILIFLIVSCGPSAEEIATQTATAATSIAALWTKTPTPTLTHSPTLTPTLTQTPTTTPTRTPTPLGGGSGQIACSNCKFKVGYSVSMSIVKSDGTGAIVLSDKSSIGASFAWSKNGARLAYFTITGLTGSENQRKGLTCVVDVYALNEQCFEVGGGSFTLSPDGTKLAIGEHSPALYLVDVDSGKSETLMEAPIQWSGWDVDWSPDGTKLVVAGGGIGITVINIINNEKYVLVEGDKPDYYTTPRWSPDGKKIVYVKRSNLFIVNADGSDETLLVQNAYNPLWSPDGTLIAYITGNNDQRNIIVMNADGTNKVRLTPSQALQGNIIWTPNGKFIVYLVYVGSPYNGLYDIYVAEVNSQKLVSITKTHDVLSYTLSPDGSAIAYTIGSYEAIGKGECFKSFIASLDSTILSEWKDISCGGIVGPWRPN